MLIFVLLSGFGCLSIGNDYTTHSLDKEIIKHTLLEFCWKWCWKTQYCCERM